jgi:hypothetical protein
VTRYRKSEVGLLVKLLERDWESVEDLAKALIEALDEDRAKRTSYVAIAQMGSRPGQVWYLGLGPYPGKASATAAAQSHPGFSLATAIVVVPVTSPLGVDRLLREVG